jgi:hypothetical protein
MEAIPPDDVHTVANVLKCGVCLYNGFPIPEGIIECDDCHFRNIINWHRPEAHSPKEKLRASLRLSEELSNESDTS